MAWPMKLLVLLISVVAVATEDVAHCGTLLDVAARRCRGVGADDVDVACGAIPARSRAIRMHRACCLGLGSTKSLASLFMA